MIRKWNRRVRECCVLCEKSFWPNVEVIGEQDHASHVTCLMKILLKRLEKAIGLRKQAFVVLDIDMKFIGVFKDVDAVITHMNLKKVRFIPKTPTTATIWSGDKPVGYLKKERIRK